MATRHTVDPTELGELPEGDGLGDRSPSFTGYTSKLWGDGSDPEDMRRFQSPARIAARVNASMEKTLGVAGVTREVGSMWSAEGLTDRQKLSAGLAMWDGRLLLYDDATDRLEELVSPDFSSDPGKVTKEHARAFQVFIHESLHQTVGEGETGADRSANSGRTYRSDAQVGIEEGMVDHLSFSPLVIRQTALDFGMSEELATKLTQEIGNLMNDKDAYLGYRTAMGAKIFQSLGLQTAAEKIQFIRSATPGRPYAETDRVVSSALLKDKDFKRKSESWKAAEPSRSGMDAEEAANGFLNEVFKNLREGTVDPRRIYREGSMSAIDLAWKKGPGRTEKDVLAAIDEYEGLSDEGQSATVLVITEMLRGLAVKVEVVNGGTE